VQSIGLKPHPGEPFGVHHEWNLLHQGVDMVIVRELHGLVSGGLTQYPAAQCKHPFSLSDIRQLNTSLHFAYFGSGHLIFYLATRFN
jgi:hypothetical protein